jgi:hypothetical protein
MNGATPISPPEFSRDSGPLRDVVRRRIEQQAEALLQELHRLGMKGPRGYVGEVESLMLGGGSHGTKFHVRLLVGLGHVVDGEDLGAMMDGAPYPSGDGAAP